MYRLPIPETLIDAIIDFLKSNYEKAYTSRQIAQYFWDHYTYCEFKTFDQVYREVNGQLAKHKNKSGIYSQTRVLQITEHQTVPYSYQYKDVTENTTLLKVDTDEKVIKQLSFEGLIPNEELLIDDIKIEEEASLLEDIKASDIINKLHNNKASLVYWLETTDDKEGTIAEIMKIIEQYS